MSIYNINFNNLNSYEDFKLYIKSRPNIPLPEKNINVITIEGANGDLIEDLGTYKSIEIPIQFNAAYKNDFNGNFRQIKAWLLNIADNKMILSDDTDYFYKVEYVKLDSNAERKYKILGNFTATFVCKPFSYSFDGLNTIIILENGIKINNEGTYKADPIIYLYGNGDITLTINNSNINLSDINGGIVLDSILKEAYSLDKSSNLNNLMNGNFPNIEVGENIISWTGNVTKIEIVPNWCYL